MSLILSVANMIICALLLVYRPYCGVSSVQHSLINLAEFAIPPYLYSKTSFFIKWKFFQLWCQVLLSKCVLEFS